MTKVGSRWRQGHQTPNIGGTANTETILFLSEPPASASPYGRTAPGIYSEQAAIYYEMFLLSPACSRLRGASVSAEEARGAHNPRSMVRSHDSLTNHPLTFVRQGLRILTRSRHTDYTPLVSFVALLLPFLRPCSCDHLSWPLRVFWQLLCRLPRTTPCLAPGTDQAHLHPDPGLAPAHRLTLDALLVLVLTMIVTVVHLVSLVGDEPTTRRSKEHACDQQPRTRGADGFNHILQSSSFFIASVF